MITDYNITIEDLPEELATLAEKIGLESTLKIVSAYGGTSLYIPKADRVAREARNRKICDEFNGKNTGDLARKYNLSESQIREILKEKRRAMRCGKKEWQLSLPFN